MMQRFEQFLFYTHLHPDSFQPPTWSRNRHEHLRHP